MASQGQRHPAPAGDEAFLHRPGVPHPAAALDGPASFGFALIVLALTAAVPLAAQLYRWVERPSHRLGRFVLRRERAGRSIGQRATQPG